MTDAEIIKGTECCSSKKIVCADCPYYCSDNCAQNLGKDTIDLINRQKAEIERLTINMNAFGLGMKREKERADTAREEAMKEFAERLKAKKYIHFCKSGERVDLTDVFNGYIDTLVKEMAGDTE